MATDFNALYKEFLTNISDKKYYSDYMSFLSRGDNYRFSYDNQIIMFVQSGKSFEFHTYNEYIAKGYKPFGPCSVLTYKCFNVNESNRKYWDNSSVIRIGAVSTPNAINENDKYHAEFPLIQNDEVYERLYSSLQKDDVFSHEYDSDADIKNKFKSSISLLTRTLVRNIMKEKDRNVSNNPLVTEDNIASAIEYTLKAKLGIANEDDFGRLANPFSNTEGTPDRKIVDTFFFALNNCLKEIEGPIYQCFIRNKASAIYCGPGNDTQTTWTRYRGGSGIQTAAGWGGFSGGGGGYYGGAVTTDNGGHSYGGTGYIASTVNGYDAGGQIVNGDNRADSQGSHIEITPIFVDQQSVKDLVGKDQTATLTAIWSTTAAKFFKLNVSSVSDDIAKLNGIDDLIGKEYYEVGGLSKNITLPDLGKENGFMGWLDNMNGSIVRSVSFVPGSSGIYSYTALWADHYAVSVWGINHDDGLNSGGIVFGSAMNTTNNDYDISYIGNSPSRHVHDGECIHNDYVQGGWARVIYYCQNDPERYRKCMEYGCTVPVYFYGKNGDMQYGKQIYSALTTLGGDTGIGDGATQLDYTTYQSKGDDDTDHDTGGWRNASGGKNKAYTAYDNSDMPDKMNELYNALCNSSLKAYISDSAVRFATQSKSYVKGLWDSSAAGGRMAVTAPVTINSDGTTTKGTETIGANFIHDLRNGVDSSYKDVEVYNYATISGQKFFLPSAHEIYGNQTDYNWCKMFQQGYDYDDTTYVLDYLDGEQYEKFKDYSFNGNLFIASYGTKYGIKKDNARLNTKNSYGTRSVVLRTPGSSLTRARVTYLYSYGGLNTAGFTTQDYAVTPCFRIK